MVRSWVWDDASPADLGILKLGSHETGGAEVGICGATRAEAFLHCIENHLHIHNIVFVLILEPKLDAFG
jgi:hypothetical protein